MSFQAANLDDFLTQYGDALAQKARAQLDPLHIPGRDQAVVAPLLRAPFDAQAHVVTATVKLWRREKAVQMVAEMGSGKTLMALAAIHTHGDAKPYRALIVCPGQLTKKWAREILDTIPDAKVVIVKDYKTFLRLSHGRVMADKGYRWTDPSAPEFWVIGRDRLKLSSTWRACYRRRAVELKDNEGWVVGTHWKVAGAATIDEKRSRCPACGEVLVNKDGELLEEKFLKAGRRTCKFVYKRQADGGFTHVAGCGEQLWQEVPKPRRYSPAKIIQKQLKGFFDYLIVDEAHEYKGTDSIQADAIGAVASACKKVAALTGTLVGGYAWHVRTLLFRIGGGATMVGDGFGWKDEKAWNEEYGRIETKIVESDNGSGGRSHHYAKGEKEAKKTSYVRPGIVPTMFKHLIGNSIFLALDEVAANLPALLEDVVEVELDAEQARAYKETDKALMEAIRQMIAMGNKKLLGTMLNCLLCYPDYPFDWGLIGYYDSPENGGGFVPVVKPRHLNPDVLRPKEKALVERVLQERNEGRQVWIYCQYTDKRDCISRVRLALEKEGLRVKVMRAAVNPEEREDWINKHGNTCDVIVSHPDLVKTGLDFFNRRAGHNFVTIMFYQTGYNLFTLRQAARRAWRIGQRRECRVLYFYYQGTMQERAMTLMGRKLSAANALEGKFSAEGLAAMAGDDENMEMALAKSLADGIKEEGASRAWAKLTTATAPSARFAPSDNAESLEDFYAKFAADMAELGVTV